MADAFSMSKPRRTRLPPGRQLYDPLNGLRVGVFAGVIVGAVAFAVTGLVWTLFSAAVLGGVIGYVSERRKLGPPT